MNTPNLLLQSLVKILVLLMHVQNLIPKICETIMFLILQPNTSIHTHTHTNPHLEFEIFIKFHVHICSSTQVIILKF